MKRRLTAIITAVLMATATLALAAGPSAPLSTPTLKQTIATNGKPTLIFFENPNGGPCRMQKAMLDLLAEKRKGTFNIASVSTLERNDQRGFYDYGVRSLPMLVLVDKAGKISKVFPPGIQSIESIASALDGLK
ncbi:MAG: thioredoxin family protein [Desulfuromonadaceae bacterium]|nr:thioredoxin family protein [Desulfuromonadaceae bacterium]MDD2847678.1 thioredoxin family protein [Desulfuromonadaceae bacterium]MDD4131076.1 thioredoxin family protein [Desulfuromonadaceae bacterium]